MVGDNYLGRRIASPKTSSRLPVCGFIAHYNDETLMPGPNQLPLRLSTLLQKRIRMQGFIIFDHYADRFDAFRRDMGEWVG